MYIYIYIQSLYIYIHNMYIYIYVCDVAELPFTSLVDFKDAIIAMYGQRLYVSYCFCSQ